jgi:hypothetical protein
MTRNTSARGGEPVTAAEDRLATIGELLRECAPPDLADGQDQCAHGTWPCVITQAAWRAQGRDLRQQAQTAHQAATQRAQSGHASRDAGQEPSAAGLGGTMPSTEADGEPPPAQAKARTPQPGKQDAAPLPPPRQPDPDPQLGRRPPEYLIEAWVSPQLKARTQHSAASARHTQSGPQRRGVQPEPEAEP